MFTYSVTTIHLILVHFHLVVVQLYLDEILGKKWGRVKWWETEVCVWGGWIKEAMAYMKRIFSTVPSQPLYILFFLVVAFQ